MLSLTLTSIQTKVKKMSSEQCYLHRLCTVIATIIIKTRMWANAQRDGRLTEHRWRPLFNAANFG